MKPERVQLVADRPEQWDKKIGDWDVDPTPNAITRHFPQSSFTESVRFLTEVAKQAEEHDSTPFAVVDANGVTLRLGNPPKSGVKECELKLAAAISQAAGPQAE